MSKRVGYMYTCDRCNNKEFVEDIDDDCYCTWETVEGTGYTKTLCSECFKLYENMWTSFFAGTKMEIPSIV